MMTNQNLDQGQLSYAGVNQGIGKNDKSIQLDEFVCQKQCLVEVIFTLKLRSGCLVDKDDNCCIFLASRLAWT
ncbi:hypothetical protein ACS0TY_023352 [Phlomoides rotata]